MLSLEAYSVATLQSFKQLLHAIGQEGMSVDLAKANVENAIKTRAGVTRLASQRTTRKINKNKPQAAICPSCGRLSYEPYGNVEGLDIVMCNPCGYSEVVK